ncbi:MAG: bifunctional pyr operon transcriptional regulator/uracil phosphoribosyltransferase PyrR [Gammaproteobacteria bacterium]
MKIAAHKKSTADINTALDEMANKLAELLRSSGRDHAVLIGIRTGGVWVADALHKRLKFSEPVGGLNIAYHRDDFARKGLHPTVEASDLPFGIEGRHVVLVDDILYTGRTVRAALNEIFDFGRPASVTLVVLVDRGGRELPIEADVAGMQMTLAAGEHVKLTGPEPLALSLQKSA